jgi:hypothetical protein
MRSVDRSRFAGIMPALAVSVATWAAIAPPAVADSSFIGDMLVTNDLEPGVVLAFDPSTGAYQEIFANLGANYDANPSFSGIAFDSSGNLYVMANLGAEGSKTNQYNPTTGAYIRTVVSGLQAAVGVTFASGSLYVTDAYGIQQFSTSGSLGITFGGNYFYQITTGLNGNLYAADGVNSVYEFTPSGTQVGSAPFVTGVSGAYGSGFGPDGSLYVADTGDSVFKFDTNGNMVGSGVFFSSGLLMVGTDVLYDALSSSNRPGCSLRRHFREGCQLSVFAGRNPRN